MEERNARENRIPIVGNVAASSPILAQECVEDYLTFDTGSRSGEFFALRVRGESMLGVGILPDMILRRIPYRIEIRPLANPYYRPIGLAAKTFGNRGFGALEHLHHNGGKVLHLHNGVLHREAALFQRRVILDRAAV